MTLPIRRFGEDAMISCCGCKKELPDPAAACPHCGCPDPAGSARSEASWFSVSSAPEKPLEKAAEPSSAVPQKIPVRRTSSPAFPAELRALGCVGILFALTQLLYSGFLLAKKLSISGPEGTDLVSGIDLEFWIQIGFALTALEMGFASAGILAGERWGWLWFYIAGVLFSFAALASTYSVILRGPGPGEDRNALYLRQFLDLVRSLAFPTFAAFVLTARPFPKKASPSG